jgi:hypothetical protein
MSGAVREGPGLGGYQWTGVEQSGMASTKLAWRKDRKLITRSLGRVYGCLAPSYAPWTATTTTMATPKEFDGTRSVSPTLNEDDRELEALGYVPSFKREFSNLATVRFSVYRLAA